MTEDATDFFSAENEFISAATITGISGTVYGYYDREYVDIAEIAGYRPVLTCSTADVSGVGRGANVVVSGESGTFIVAQNVKVDSIESKLILDTAQ